MLYYYIAPTLAYTAVETNLAVNVEAMHFAHCALEPFRESHRKFFTVHSNMYHEHTHTHLLHMEPIRTLQENHASTKGEPNTWNHGECAEASKGQEPSTGQPWVHLGQLSFCGKHA